MKNMVPLKSYFKVSLRKELKKSSKLKIEDIAEIQQWMTTQPNLPPSPDILIAHFMQASNCDMEVAKKAIRLNFEYKRSMTEFFDEWDPLSDDVQVQVNHVAYFAFLPKKSPSLPRLCFTRFRENSVALFDFALAVKWTLMSFQSILFLEGQQEFNTIIDAAPFTFKHALKHPLRLVRQYDAYKTHAAPVRMTGIHFINTNAALRKMVGFLKMFVSKTIFEMVHLHGAPEEYFDSIHPDSVPQDYGGTGPTLESLHVVTQSHRQDVSLESYFKVSLKKELKKSPKLKIGDIAEIQQWMSTQPNLPSSQVPEEYFDSISSDSVPQDYGGTGPTLESLHEENTKRVLETRNALIAFCDFK